MFKNTNFLLDQADSDHFHHRLLKLGFSHRRAVLILYGATIFLGCIALLVINVTEKYAGMAISLLALLIIIFIKQLGYLRILSIRSLARWMSDLVNAVGLNRDRRVFLSYQLAILEARDVSSFWAQVVETAKHLKLDYVEMQLGGRECNFKKFDESTWHALNTSDIAHELYSNHRLYLRLPVTNRNQQYGILKVSTQYNTAGKTNSQLFYRLEILRRTLGQALCELQKNPANQLADRRSTMRDDRREAEIQQQKALQTVEERRVNGLDRRQDLDLN